VKVIKYVHEVDPHNEGNINYDQYMDISKSYIYCLQLIFIVRIFIVHPVFCFFGVSLNFLA
jgi:hypothetical protein